MDRRTLVAVIVTSLLTALLLGAGAWLAGWGADRGQPAPVPPPLRKEEAPSPPPTPRLEGGAPASDATELAALRLRIEELEARLVDLTAREAQRGDALLRLLAAQEAARDPRSLPDAERAAANHVAAVATLRNTTAALAQIQASGKIDTDHDGVGEFGGFLEMSGAIRGRMVSPLIPPVLSGVFRQLDPAGFVPRSGYCFRIYLPGPGGRGVAEPTDGFADDGLVDADLAETTWCSYAWPAEASSGRYTYFANQAGDVLVTEDPRYVGPGGAPDADAAFLARGAITGKTAIGTRGSDGNLWQPAR